MCRGYFAFLPKAPRCEKVEVVEVAECECECECECESVRGPKKEVEVAGTEWVLVRNTWPGQLYRHFLAFLAPGLGDVMREGKARRRRSLGQVMYSLFLSLLYE